MKVISVILKMMGTQIRADGLCTFCYYSYTKSLRLPRKKYFYKKRKKIMTDIVPVLWFMEAAITLFHRITHAGSIMELV